MQNTTRHDGRRDPAAAAERVDDVGGEGTRRERMRGPKTIGCAKTANNMLPVLAERVHSVTVMIYLSHSTGEFSLLVDLLRTRLGG